MLYRRWLEAGVVFATEADVETQIFDAVRRPNGGRMHDRGPISRQQTTHSDASGREPRTIRNELSERNRRNAFAGVYTGRPDADRTNWVQRAIYDRRCGLRPTARLSSFLRDAGRQLHGTGRSDELSGPCVRRFRVSGFRSSRCAVGGGAEGVVMSGEGKNQ
jgi:hypothetical protein